MSENVGVIIDAGLNDWQIIQQDNGGFGKIRVSGRWKTDLALGAVELRLVHEETGAPVTAYLDWTPAEASPDGSWSGELSRIPAGGLYRLETHLLQKGNIAREWAQRGDMRHFLGVGDIWIIAGQSNSAGYGRGPGYDPPELGIHVFNNAMHWALASQPLNESTDTAHPENREGGNSGHAPWLHWARLVKKALGYPIGLVQTSLGGSPLVAWNPTEPGSHPLYEIMLKAVEAAGGEASGILWYQGCSDANPQAAATYETRFIAAVQAWRDALQNPLLHVLTVQLNRWYGSSLAVDVERAWDVVREAQRQVPRKLSGISLIPTLDLPLSDGIHNSPAGNMVIAERAAAAVLGAFYERDTDWQAPEPAGIACGKNGRTIEIDFAHVSSRMECVDPRSIPFMVEDSAGIVPVLKASGTGSNVVRLELDRDLEGSAFVSGAPGSNPAPVFHDVLRFMPMLAFHRVPVV